MAKTSAIQKNLKRIKLVKKYQKKRLELKKIINNKKLELSERFAAQLKLNKLPKNIFVKNNNKKISIRSVMVDHGRVKSNCFIIDKKLAYISDVSKIYNEDFKYFKDTVLNEDTNEDLNYSFLSRTFSSLSKLQKEKILQILSNTAKFEKVG